MHDIFISYAREDKPRVKMLVSLLEEQGWSVWWDDMIGVGTKYASVLDEALAQSRCVMACWSRVSLRSEYVRSEAHRGDARHVLLQVLLEDVALPSPFSEYTVSDLSEWPDHERGQLELEKLLRDLGGRLALSSSTIPVDTSHYVPGFEGRPAVAVLPFSNQADEGEMDYVLDGVTTDITDRLQRFRSMPVISSFTVGKTDLGSDLRTIATQLGVKYLVTGALRRVGNANRLRVELIQAPTFETVWNTTQTLGEYDSSNLQDQLSLNIAAQLQPEIERSARQASLPVQHETASSWHLVRQGIWHQHKLTAEGAEQAFTLFKKAYDQDPDSPEVLIQLAWWHFWDICFRRGEPEEWKIPESYAQRAANLDPNDSRAITMIGISHIMRGEHSEGRKFYQQAMKLNPSYIWPYAHMGSSLYLDGQPEASILYSTKALRLSPRDLFSFHAYCDIASSNYLLGRYSSALEAADYSLGQRAGYWLAHVIKICTLIRMGRREQAQIALQQMLSTKPNVSRRDIEWVMFSDRSINQRIIDELSEAGWEGAQAEGVKVAECS